MWRFLIFFLLLSPVTDAKKPLTKDCSNWLKQQRTVPYRGKVYNQLTEKLWRRCGL